MIRLLISIAFLLASYAQADVVLPVAVSASPIKLSQAVYPQSGVAPLAVTVDFTGTTDASVTANPYSDLQYSCSFGDTGAGLWTTGSNSGVNSKNAATGPVQAHLYETNGDYTITCTTTDGTNTVTQTASVVVTAATTQWPTTQTICYSTGSLSSGCDTGAVYVQNVTNLAASFAANIGTGNNRHLLKRGDTFNTDTPVTINKAGPGMVGAFGSGAKPIISAPTTSGVYISTSITPNLRDWRVMDIQISGGAPNATNGGVEFVGGMDQVTLLRLVFADTRVGILADMGTLDAQSGTHLWDRIYVGDTTHSATYTDQYGAYLAGRRVAIMGNSWNNQATGSHVLRAPAANKYIVSNNTFSSPKDTRQAARFLNAGEGSPYSGVAPPISSQIVVSDNKFVCGNDANCVQYEFGDQFSIIDERNWYVAGTGAFVGAYVASSYTTVRDSIFDASNTTTTAWPIAFTKSATSTAASNSWAYNNTAYSSASLGSGNFSMMTITHSESANITMKNNLAWAPNATSPVFLTDAGASGVTNANNSSNSQVKNTTPNFTSVSPFNPTNAKPTSGYAVGGGASVPVWTDFFLVNWSPTWSLGAVHP